jgi:hypothetical protein
MARIEGKLFPSVDEYAFFRPSERNFATLVSSCATVRLHRVAHLRIEAVGGIELDARAGAHDAIALRCERRRRARLGAVGDHRAAGLGRVAHDVESDRRSGALQIIRRRLRGTRRGSGLRFADFVLALPDGGRAAHRCGHQGKGGNRNEHRRFHVFVFLLCRWEWLLREQPPYPPRTPNHCDVCI